MKSSPIPYPRILAVCLTVLALVTGRPAELAADGIDPAWFEPNTGNEEDFLLPGPGGIKFAIKRIYVPGADFWTAEGRDILLGDPGNLDGDPFSKQTRVRVMGSFLDRDRAQWWYGLGKYEVTVAQYAAVMGDGNIDAGLAKLDEVSDLPNMDKPFAELKDRERRRELARPLRGLSPFEYERFIHRLNLWIYDHLHDNRHKAGVEHDIPHLECGSGGNVERFPGYARLPTEVEWEYAARGGINTIGNNASLPPYPFEQGRFEDFAWLAPNSGRRPRPVGQREATHGLHDVIGNVSELVANRFQPEIGRGKVGALGARGGNVVTEVAQATLGKRREILLFDRSVSTDGRILENRPLYLGIRLAFAAPVGPLAACREAIVSSYSGSAAMLSAAPLASASSLTKARDLLNAFESYLTDVEQRRPDLNEFTTEFRNRLQQLDQLQAEELANNALVQVNAAVISAASYARLQCKVERFLKIVLPRVEFAFRTEAERQVKRAEYEEQLNLTIVHANLSRNSYYIALSSMLDYSDEFIATAFQQYPALRDLDESMHPFLVVTQKHFSQARNGKAKREEWIKDLEALYNLETLQLC